MEPLHPDLRKAEYKRYQVWVTFDESAAKVLRRFPKFRDTPRGTTTFLWSSHRVGPKKMYGLGQHQRPSPDEIWQADQESKRLAQHQAILMFGSEHVKRVKINCVWRKEATGRFVRGQQITEFVAEMLGPEDRFIDGEPSERSLAIEQGREE